MTPIIVELTGGERLLLDRALRVYAAHYQQLISTEKHPSTKIDLQNRITATHALIWKIRTAAGMTPPRPRDHDADESTAPRG